MNSEEINYDTAEFNKDELIAPNWVTKEYLEEFLQKHHNDDAVQVKNYHVSPASKKGDHYASIMFRIKLEYTVEDGSDKEISVVLKTLPDEDCHKKEMLKESFIFETEISIYEKTLPKFEAVLKQHGDNTLLGAKMFHSTVQPRKMIIFEDLGVKGFTSIGIRTATLEEIKMSLVKLAKWHAVSYKLHLEGDETISQYNEGVFNMPNVETVEMFADGLKQFIPLLKGNPELQEYVPKFEKLQKKNLLKQCTGIYNLGRSYRDDSSSGIYVLNHGDFHSKNMMFKMDKSGISTDVLMVDFQMCVWGPAIIDVIYFTYMMLSPIERLTKRDELYHFYFTNFIDTLKMIKFTGPLPKLTDLYIDLIKYRYFEIFLMVTFLPLMHGMTVREHVLNLEISEIVESAECKNIFYNNPDFIKEIKVLLKQFLYKGYLD